MIDKKVALVTGSARGIGYEIARQLADSSYAVVLNDVIEESVVAKALKQMGKDAVFVRADVSSSADRNRVLDTVKKTMGRIDLLVNNAGVAPRHRADILNATEESFERLININLKGPYFLTQLFANWMIELKEQNASIEPRIINISSISSYTSSPGRGDYCISKAGVSMLTRLYADRLAEFGIQVFEIRPGIIATDMTRGAKDKYDKLISEGLTPIKRWGKPEDIARAVVAVASGYFPFSTGEVINVDGGFHLRRL